MSVKKYTCEICIKDYKTPQSLWNHKHKLHSIIHLKSTDNTPTINSLSTMNQHIYVDIPKIKKTDNTLCEYCNNNFSSYSSLHRHLKTCKAKTNIVKENDNLKQEMSEMKKSLDELKKIMLDMMNKKCKMHPNTLKNMINNTNSNNTINMTINNNIQYIELGDEELHKVFSRKEKMRILCGLGSPIDKIIKHTHLNDNYPQFQTIIITNIKGNQAYIYNKHLKRFIVMDKTEILENLIEHRFDDLQQFYEDCKDKIEPEQRECLERLFLLKYNDKYYVNKSKEFNVIIYNECNKDNIKYKPIDDIDDCKNEILT
jgi:hypothetical protein